MAWALVVAGFPRQSRSNAIQDPAEPGVRNRAETLLVLTSSEAPAVLGMKNVYHPGLPGNRSSPIRRPVDVEHLFHRPDRTIRIDYRSFHAYPWGPETRFASKG